MTRRTYSRTKGRGKTPPFVGLPLEMLDSVAFRTLKPHAVKLLVAISRGFYGTNNGSLAMPFEVARGWGFSNERTYTAALAQLVDHGFLERTRSAVRRGRPMAARWAITWRPIDEPVGDHQHYATPTERPSNDWREWAPSRPAKVPVKKRHSTGKSASRRSAEVPGKVPQTSEATGKSASQKSVFGDFRQADMPADLISTRAGDKTGYGVMAVELVPGGICVRGVLR